MNGRFTICGSRKSQTVNRKSQSTNRKSQKKMGAGSFPHSHYQLSIINYPLPLHHLAHGHALRHGDTKRIDTL